jgi:hypothetical protein
MILSILQNRGLLVRPNQELEPLTYTTTGNSASIFRQSNKCPEKHGVKIRHVFADTFLLRSSNCTFYLALPTRAGSPATAYANYCGPFLPNPPCQLSLLEETGVPGENPRLSAERWLLLFSHEDWVRVALRKFSLRFEPAASEVKGKCANHLATP